MVFFKIIEYLVPTFILDHAWLPGSQLKYNLSFTVWSEGFLYKVALPELKISPIMYFVIHNSLLTPRTNRLGSGSSKFWFFLFTFFSKYPYQHQLGCGCASSWTEWVRVCFFFLSVTKLFFFLSVTKVFLLVRKLRYWQEEKKPCEEKKDTRTHWCQLLDVPTPSLVLVNSPNEPIRFGEF